MTYRTAYNVGIGICLLGIGVIIGMTLPFDHIATDDFVLVLPLWVLGVAMWVVGGKMLLMFREINKDVDAELERQAKKESK